MKYKLFPWPKIEISPFSPSRRREAPCEGTNSPRLFTPGRTKALEHFKTFCEAFVVEFYLKLKLILRIISYLTYICWETDNFVIKSDIFQRDFSFVRIFLKNYRVTMTTTLDTSCSGNTMVLSARRGFLHACIF
jgi:hypothetical protein